MKRFLANCGTIGIIIGICVLFIIGLRYAKLQTLADDLFATKEGQHILVLGDSHPDNAFVEVAGNGIKKLVYSGSPLNISFMRLLELEKRTNLSNIDVCIANIDYTYILEWSYKLQIESAWRLMPFCFDKLDMLPTSRIETIRGLIDFTCENINEIPPLAQTSGGADASVSIAGHSPEWVRAQVDDAIERHFRRRERHPELFVPDATGRMMETILAFKKLCEQHGIRLILFSAPLSQEYRDGVPDWAKKELRGLVAEIRDEGIEYYDFTEWGRRDWLADSDHLNKTGAEQFTNMFLNDIIRGVAQ